MAIPIRKGREIDFMKAACATSRDVLLELASELRAGITTGEIDRIAAEKIKSRHCVSAFYQYKVGKNLYPGHICISLNEEVVHGIGSNRVIQDGDIVKLDVGVIQNGWVGDNAITVPIGKIPQETEALLRETEASLHAAIQFAVDGVMLGDLCHAVENHVKKYGFTVVTNFAGHGVGRKLHEEPSVPNHGKPGTGPRLREGMMLAIEPMVNLGVSAVKILPDKWTVVTADGKPSSHYEHTVMVGKESPLILTDRPRMWS